MIVSEQIIEKQFGGKNLKEAYLNCCKWISSNIIAKTNCENITYKTFKHEDKIILKVYVTADEEEIKERHCKICKEVSSMFYLSENKYKCESCKMIPYRERIKERIKSLEIVIGDKIK